MIRLTLLMIATLAGCSAQQIDTLRTDEQRAEQVFAATTQATADARAAVATMPPNSPAARDATRAIERAETVERTTRVALDLAQAALDAAQKRDPSDPKLTAAVSSAVAA